jgi:hypothetical protein
MTSCIRSTPSNQSRRCWSTKTISPLHEKTLIKPKLQHRSTVESTCFFRGVCASARSGTFTKHRAIEIFEAKAFFSYKLAQILVTADSADAPAKVQRNQRHSEAESPLTTIVLSSVGITLGLPFLLFQIPAEPSCSSTRETDDHDWIAQRSTRPCRW